MQQILVSIDEYDAATPDQKERTMKAWRDLSADDSNAANMFRNPKLVAALADAMRNGPTPATKQTAFEVMYNLTMSHRVQREICEHPELVQLLKDGYVHHELAQPALLNIFGGVEGQTHVKIDQVLISDLFDDLQNAASKNPTLSLAVALRSLSSISKTDENLEKIMAYPGAPTELVLKGAKVALARQDAKSACLAAAMMFRMAAKEGGKDRLTGLLPELRELHRAAKAICANGDEDMWCPAVATIEILLYTLDPPMYAPPPLSAKKARSAVPNSCLAIAEFFFAHTGSRQIAERLLANDINNAECLEMLWKNRARDLDKLDLNVGLKLKLEAALEKLFG